METLNILLARWTRSKSIAITLSEIGWEVYLLRGLQNIQKKVNHSLNKIIKDYKFIILRGKTGTAKTRIIEKLIFNGSAINLENLAKHKGSLLGIIQITSTLSKIF